MKSLTKRSEGHGAEVAISGNKLMAFACQGAVAIRPGVQPQWSYELRTWDTKKWNEPLMLTWQTQAHTGIGGIASSPDGRYVYVGDTDGFVTVIGIVGRSCTVDRETWAYARTGRAHEVSRIVLTRDGKQLVTVSATSTDAKLWAIKTPHTSAASPDHDPPIGPTSTPRGCLTTFCALIIVASILLLSTF